MKRKPYVLFALLLSMSCWTATHAQLFIDTDYTAEEMVLDFFNNTCVTPSNITYTGADGTYAFFDAGDTELGVAAGIYLGSGFAVDAVGPNTASGTTGVTGGNGDLDLDNLLGGLPTYDAAVLEMDIVATGTELSFSYVFASEEYPEFVNFEFNDIFAFFISGPGIDGMANIAMVPNSSDPVSINTVNEGQNAEYHVDNTDGMGVQFDGHTTELIASATVVPNETYHIKIAVADAADAAFDSGIFLGVESLCGDSLLVPPAQYIITVDDLTVNVENTSRYATSYHWDFGDNTTSTDKNPGPHTYAEDGVYDVTLTTQNYCCSDTYTTQVMVGNTTSIDDIIEKPYQFFPNPVKDAAQLTFAEGRAFEVQLFDAAGRLLQRHEGNSLLQLDLQNLSEGIYFLDVISEGQTYREKVLKL